MKTSSKGNSQRCVLGEALSERERRFVEAYMGPAAGNAAKAAVIAGYSPKTARQAGHRMSTKVNIRDAIAARQAEDPNVLTREELQGIWSGMVRDCDLPAGDRLRASELLAKSLAMFVHRVQAERGATLEEILAGSRRLEDVEAQAAPRGLLRPGSSGNEGGNLRVE